MRTFIHVVCLSILSVFLCAVGAGAIEQLPHMPEVLFDYGAAVDGDRGIVVLFGGSTPGGQLSGATWILDLAKGQWEKQEIQTGPSPRTHPVMVYLAAKKKIILFGGRDNLGNYLGDTWSFDGKKWKQLQPSPSPPARGSAAAAPSPDGTFLLLFGGFNAALGDLNDTWLFDGKGWKRVATAAGPPPRSEAAMAADPHSGGILLYGGYGLKKADATLLEDHADTWLFFGSSWKKIETADSPGPRSAHRMATDFSTGEIFLLDGISQGKDIKDLWAFDGKNWKAATIPLPGAPAPDINLETDPVNKKVYYLLLPVDEITIQTRTLSIAYMNDTWAYAGQKWQEIPTDPSPHRRCYTDLAFDEKRGVAVLFGGSTNNMVNLDDTWEFDGQAWKPLSPDQTPGARSDHQLVYDAKRGRVLLFGGFGAGESGDRSFDDTWSYDGKTWTRLRLATTPPARSRHSMTYDTRRNLTWMFGGYDALAGEFNDLWKFDGKDWSRVEGANPPSARGSASLAFDPKDGMLYLFGGYNKARGSFGDTWSFDPDQNAWELLETDPAPPAREDAGFVYDRTAQALTLFAGYDGRGDMSDLWVLVGGKWKEIDARGPAGRSYFGMTFDTVRNQVMIFGGYGMGMAVEQPQDGFMPSVKPGTWEFDGKTWKNIDTAHLPTADLSYAMAYDPKRKIMVLFGGYNEVKGELDETWLYDGKDWRWLPTEVHPGKRTNASLVYDPVQKKILCFGGYSPERGPLNDLWEFDGSRWKKLPVKCPYSNYTGGASFVYDSNRKVFVYYGGRVRK